MKIIWKNFESFFSKYFPRIIETANGIVLFNENENIDYVLRLSLFSRFVQTPAKMAETSLFLVCKGWHPS